MNAQLFPFLVKEGWRVAPRWFECAHRLLVKNGRVFVALLLTLSLLSPAWSESLELLSPSPKDTCPVCGMFVALYPDWVATALYKDGHVHYFDGAKDLFKYLLNLPKYAPNHQITDIAALGVTEYYGLIRIDARTAWYVIGSDTLGPMGHELVPLATQAEAEEFLKDHQGQRIVRFDDVTLELLENLDRGEFQ
ncbi:MAG: nitrous oxide reductase accessory protein NosL [Candidatus Competibacteraceae bacterium]|nr:nitrous oxide reductase accessory protein NosL [Candidatus Competibacteraceae bacterium]MCB1822686.1 nitrous oxide reductase accessory protein NosL [Candidatus Competibacteraceae bacterium]